MACDLTFKQVCDLISKDEPNISVLKNIESSFASNSLHSGR